MSTYWGYKCLDCDEESDTWFNRGESKLIELAKVSDLIMDIYEKCECEWLEISLLNQTSPIDWIRKHGRHNIILYNEYGDTKPINKQRQQKCS